MRVIFFVLCIFLTNIRLYSADSNDSIQADTLLQQIKPIKADTLARDTTKTDTSIIVRHDFNHKEQVIVGGVVMASLVLILVSLNNWNPK